MRANLRTLRAPGQMTKLRASARVATWRKLNVQNRQPEPAIGSMEFEALVLNTLLPAATMADRLKRQAFMQLCPGDRRSGVTDFVSADSKYNVHTRLEEQQPRELYGVTPPKPDAGKWTQSKTATRHDLMPAMIHGLRRGAFLEIMRLHHPRELDRFLNARSGGKRKLACLTIGEQLLALTHAHEHGSTPVLATSDAAKDVEDPIPGNWAAYNKSQRESALSWMCELHGSIEDFLVYRITEPFRRYITSGGSLFAAVHQRNMALEDQPTH